MSNLTVPTDWEVLPSAVEGIEVWGPRPHRRSDTDAPEGGYRCEKCGGGVSFDVAQGAVACGWCGHVSAPAQPAVGREARAEAFTDQAIATATQGWALHRRELHCDGCGVDLAVEDGDLAATCAFCGSSRVLLRDDVVQSLRPSALVPFKVQGTELAQRLRSWLGRGWIHPPDLAQGSILDEITGVYVPFWTFDALAHARWEAEVGTRRTRTVYRNGRAVTQSYIHWSWRSGKLVRTLPDYVQCGSARLHRPLLQQIGRFDLADLVTYRPELLAGFRAQSYDIGLTEAWDAARHRMREDVRAACTADTNSSHVRNMSVEADFDEEHWRYVLLPLYLGAYRFEGRIYHVLVNGQSGRISGQRPVVWWKVWAAVGASFVPSVFLGLIGVPLTLIGVGLVVLVVALIAFIAAAIWSWGVVAHARRSEGVS